MCVCVCRACQSSVVGPRVSSYAGRTPETHVHVSTTLLALPPLPVLTGRPVFQPFRPASRECPVFRSHGEILVENSVKYMSPNGFFCTQILLNSLSAGALLRTLLWELTSASRLRRQEGNTSSLFHAPSMPLAWRFHADILS